MKEFPGIKVRFSVGLRKPVKDRLGVIRADYEIGKEEKCPLRILLVGFAHTVIQFYCRISGDTVENINAEIKQAGALILQLQVSEKGEKSTEGQDQSQAG